MTDLTSISVRASARAGAPASTGWRLLGRHYVEMVLAMIAGMVLFGGLRQIAGLTVAFTERPGLSFLLMATDMTIGMASWMAIRGHSWAGILEMSAPMYLPVVLLPFVWSGAMGSMTFMISAHLLMMGAMFAVLLRRRADVARCQARGLKASRSK